jgi:hypothetical protein
MKGYTSIPFAREVAELLVYPDKYVPDFKRRDFTFWASTTGLENRYWSIDQLLNDLPDVISVKKEFYSESQNMQR